MKRLITIIALATLGFSTWTQAQQAPTTAPAVATSQAPFVADPKLEWATKVVALQQGPDMDRLVSNLAGSTTRDMINNWQPRMLANVAKPDQAKVTAELDAELQKYANEVNKIIRSKLEKVSTDALVPLYLERFTLEELKQIATFLEAPAIRKYQGIAPELGSIFANKLIEASRAEVIARAKQFDEVATRIVGPAPAAAPAAAPAKATTPTAKPAKK
jgi:hypothetical protein